MRKTIQLFVEGQGDTLASVYLARKVITSLGAWDAVALDERPFRVRDFNHLAKDDFEQLRHYLLTANKTGVLGGVLILLDADAMPSHYNGCVVEASRALALAAREAGAGSIFSIAIAIARQEFESWLVASFSSFVGKRIKGKSDSVRESTVEIPPNLEEHPRNPKKLLEKLLGMSYKPNDHQLELTKLVDVDRIRTQMRSFQRFEKAIEDLVHAIRSSHHVTTPQ